jgi:hypothetical protein
MLKRILTKMVLQHNLNFNPIVQGEVDSIIDAQF